MAKKSKAVTALESFFHKTLKFGKRTTVVANVWGGSAAGFRIANIEWSILRPKSQGGGPGRGAAWFRSDPDCGSVILAAEDFVLTFGGEREAHLDAKWKLAHLLTEK